MTRKRIIFIPLFVILIALLVIGSFFDLEIDKAIFSKNNGFALFITSIGEYPIFMGVTLLSGLLVFSSFKLLTSKVLKILFLILGLFASCASVYFMGQAFVEPWEVYAPDITKLYFAILFGIILIAPIFFLGYSLSKRIKSQNDVFAILIILCSLGGLIVLSYILKGFIHRIRYTTVSVAGDIYFTNWWSPFKYYDDFKELWGKEAFMSFPSGHAMFSMASIYLLFFPKLLGFGNKKEVVLFYTGFFIFILVSFMRIILGAHYLSDVAFGGLITLIVAFAVNEILIHTFWKENCKIN